MEEPNERITQARFFSATLLMAGSLPAGGGSCGRRCASLGVSGRSRGQFSGNAERISGYDRGRYVRARDTDQDHRHPSGFR
jgi:hypothetical protein